MTLMLILAALLGVAVLVRLGWRRSAGVLAGLTAAAFLAIACGPVPRLLLTWLQQPFATRAPEHWAPSNAIVLLTAGASYAMPGAIEPGSSAYARITEAAILYRACQGTGARCTVLVSGGDAKGLGEPLAVTYSRTLLLLGVPAAAQVLETRSMNTWENARYTVPLLRNLGAARVWLVTSGPHMRRSVLCFEHFGIDAVPMRADWLRAPFSLPLASNVTLTDVALHEWLGVAAYHFYALTGWNALAALVPVRRHPPRAG